MTEAKDTENSISLAYGFHHYIKHTEGSASGTSKKTVNTQTPAASLSSRDVLLCSRVLQSAVCQQEGAGRWNDSVGRSPCIQNMGGSICMPSLYHWGMTQRGGGGLQRPEMFWIGRFISPHSVRKEAHVNARRITLCKFPLTFASHVIGFALGFRLELDRRKCGFYRREDLICQPQNSCSNWLSYVNIFCPVAPPPVRHLKEVSVSLQRVMRVEKQIGIQDGLKEILERLWSWVQLCWELCPCLSTFAKEVYIPTILKYFHINSPQIPRYNPQIPRWSHSVCGNPI